MIFFCHFCFVLVWGFVLFFVFFLGPPTFLLVANLVDVLQINPDGNGDQTLVQEPEGRIIALDYDPVQKSVRIF